MTSGYTPVRCADPMCFVVADVPRPQKDLPWLCPWHPPDDMHYD